MQTKVLFQFSGSPYLSTTLFHKRDVGMMDIWAHRTFQEILLFALFCKQYHIYIFIHTHTHTHMRGVSKYIISGMIFSYVDNKNSLYQCWSGNEQFPSFKVYP
jgi:hypothetical protein